ncbi:MAG TPA: hypothetical protein VFM97_04590 [Gammaproteobacteria bacterium]|nr:hypothetical protein [Gammaproteobacteria bacterium]
MDSLLKAVRESLILTERTARLGEETAKLSERVVTMDRRLARVEAVLELAQEGRLLPPQDKR